MEATIQLSIETEFLRDIIIPLVKLGCTYRNVGRKTVWSIPIEKTTQAEAILGQKIELYPGQLKEFLNVFKEVSAPVIIPVSHKPVKKPVLEITEVVQEDEIMYVIKGKHKVSKSIVDNLEEIIKNIDAERFENAKIPVGTIQERMARRYGMKQFNNTEGKFDKTLFFGKRSYYFHYFYYPLKVLVYKGTAIHHKGGYVSKVQKTKSNQAGAK